MTESATAGSSDGFEVLAFFTADHAVVENGKVYINGGFFNRVYYPVFPAPLSIAVVSLIKVSAEQYQRDHQFTLELQEEVGEGNPVVSLQGGFRVSPMPDAEPGEPSEVPLAIPLTGFSLPRPGDYWFILSIDAHEVARRKVRAVQVGVITQMLPQTPGGG